MSKREKVVDEFKKVVLDGIEQGQAQTGGPVGIPPITKEDREEIGKKVVAAWYVRFWNWLTGK
jgi:hypothetical protein